MAADELVAAGQARAGARRRPIPAGSRRALAAVAVAHDAGRDRLAGPGGAAVPGEPQRAAGGAPPGGKWAWCRTRPAAWRPRNRCGRGDKDVQQSQAIAPPGAGCRPRIPPARARGREREARGPPSARRRRASPDGEAGDHVAGGRARAGYPVQRRPRPGWPRGASCGRRRGGEQGPASRRRSSATRSGSRVVQGAGVLLGGPRMPGRGRRGGGGSGRGRGRAVGHRGQGQGHQRGLHECRCYHGYHARPARRASTARASLLLRSAP